MLDEKPEELECLHEELENLVCMECGELLEWSDVVGEPEVNYER